MNLIIFMTHGNVPSKKPTSKPYHFDVNGYIATGALRAGLYHKAEEIWDEIIEQLLNNKPVAQNKFVSNKFSSKYGEKALLSLKKYLMKIILIFLS